MLVVDYLDNALLNCQSDRHFEHLIVHLLVEACGGFNFFMVSFVECSRGLNIVLLKYGVHTSLKGRFLIVVILPVRFLSLEVFDLLNLVLQIPGLPLAIHLLLIINELEDTA